MIKKMDEISVTYLQILKYFNFKNIKQTSFVGVYSNNFYDYAIFLNKEKDNAISVLDIEKRGLINKLELLLKLSEKLNYKSFINEIKIIENNELNLIEPILLDDLINYLYSFFPLEKGNKNIKEFKTEYLFSGQFNTIYQDKDENIITPLFIEEQMINYYVESEKIGGIKFNNQAGYFISKLMEENYKILFSFGMNNIVRYFINNLNTEYLSIIPNPNINFKSVNCIVEKIKEIGDEKFEKIIFLYNSNKIEELKSVLDMFICFGNIKSQYNLFLNIFHNKVTLKILPPKDIKILKVTQFFTELNKELLEILEFPDSDNEKKQNMKNFFFELKSFNYGNEKSQIISFEPKVEIIQILLENLNKLIFGDDTHIIFFDVNSIIIENNDEDFESLF